jgi:CubicO group peptidase (beta-lactamase class C family)
VRANFEVTICVCLAMVAACGGRVTTNGIPEGAAFAGSAGRGAASSGAGAAGVASTGSEGARGGAPGGAGSPGIAGSSGAASRVGQLRDYLGDPSYPDDFWSSSPLIAVHALDDAKALIARSAWEIHSLLVVWNGQIVFEQYGWKSGNNAADPDKSAHQVTPNERHLLFSSTKSFVSALVGIAIAEGAIPGVTTHAVDWFPDYASLNPSPEKSAITLEDLLTMRSGLQFTEGEQDTFEAPDPARAMLSRNVVDLPVGQVWNYSSGGSDIITEILRVSTGKTPLDYGNAKLFAPIGIVNPPWAAGQTGTQHGGWGLSLTSREMARFGELFRNSGVWQGRQVVPAAWTDESTAVRCPTAWGRHYGYHWWIPDLPGFFNSLGAFGQEIFVSREHSLVVVFTADLPSDQADQIFETLIRDYILPALPQNL